MANDDRPATASKKLTERQLYWLHWLLSNRPAAAEPSSGQDIAHCRRLVGYGYAVEKTIGRFEITAVGRWRLLDPKRESGYRQTYTTRSAIAAPLPSKKRNHAPKVPTSKEGGGRE